MSVLGKRKATEVSSDMNNVPSAKRQKMSNDIKPKSNSTTSKILSNNKIIKKNKNNQKKNKRGQPPTKGNRIEKIPSYYFFLNKYRYIAPYNFEYKCFAKGRWFNRKIYDVMISEFLAYDAVYYKNAILNGKILVCNKKVSLNYIIKNGDWITHSIHRHEPPIINKQINIIYEDSNIIIINKPFGIAIHPCGKYRYNTLIYILYNQLNKELYSAHRLDRVTSGLMILSKNKQFAAKLGEKIRNREMKKMYLARVKGKFPNKNNNNQNDNKNDDSEYITVNQRIKCKNHRKGIHEIHPNGKEAITSFKFVSFNGKSSLVECYPKTGRTHQIRLHLQYLGYPIVNDFVYGGIQPKYPNWIPSNQLEKNKLIDNIKKHWNDDCGECKTILNEINGTNTQKIRNSAPEIYLHALKYECNEWSYQVPKPYWSADDFKE